MTYHFKPGDQVRIVGNNPKNPAGAHYLTSGSRATVERVNPSNGTVTVRGTATGDPDGDELVQSLLPTDLEPVEINLAVAQLRDLVARWNNDADLVDPDVPDDQPWDSWEEAESAAIADTYRTCAAQLEALLDSSIDTESSASRQHFIDTGRYLRHGEEA